MTDKKSKLKTLHVDIYNSEVKERIDWLKDYSGITSDAELVRWMLRELQRRLEEEIRDREAARIAFKKSFVENSGKE
ncbi:MAG: divergent polysaccharide deacetylase family protein [Asgard group archaeon]|nr:divergent polysaccharide deacetylase family protein [Asgard group archaeon]